GRGEHDLTLCCPGGGCERGARRLRARRAAVQSAGSRSRSSTGARHADFRYYRAPMDAPLQQRGTRVLLILAALVVIVAGLRAAAELILPVLMALFLSLLSVPPMRRLERLGLPSALA